MNDPRPLALTALFLFSLAPRPAAQTPAERVKKLFSQNCAACHGESGDGHGTTELDRPARSFKDGGFSFGNTPEALFRTISVGIPGSPMAGFDSSLSEEERQLLADYVVTLGPPIEEVKLEDTILSVHDRPLVVRGLLPSLGEGLPWHPRGLLIGDPSGVTFEYQVDDVRLLALRQGGFVRRSDWTGRGGTALEPLGKVVHLVEGGKPSATFLSKDKALVARLSGTRVTSQGSLLDYHLVEGGRELAHVVEAPLVLSTSFGTGYKRELLLRPGDSPIQLSVRTPAIEGGVLLAKSEKRFERWQVVRPKEGPPIWIGLGSSQIKDIGQGRLEASLSLQPGQEGLGVDIMVLVLVDWNDDVQERLEHWYEEEY